jgi:hypothetical protein
MSYVPGTSKVAAVEQLLVDRDNIIREAKEHLKEAQARMKKIYDQHHQEREFKVGDCVYLRLQPYRQMSVAVKKNLKLSPRFYGPYQILEKKWGLFLISSIFPPTPKYILFSMYLC